MTAPDAALLALLRKVDSSGQGDAVTNSYRNPEGPQAAARIEALTAEVERHRLLLEGRDEFIISAGQFDAFLEWLRQSDGLPARSLSRPEGEGG